jgi:hypothetical protein
MKETETKQGLVSQQAATTNTHEQQYLLSPPQSGRVINRGRWISTILKTTVMIMMIMMMMGMGTDERIQVNAEPNTER